MSGCDKVEVLGTGEAGICYFVCCAPVSPAYYMTKETPWSSLEGKGESGGGAQP